MVKTYKQVEREISDVREIIRKIKTDKEKSIDDEISLGDSESPKNTSRRKTGKT